MYVEVFMSYLALYRKYRPVDFDSVYGQEEIVTVLKNAIISGKISHAYLFCGPRGTGKTTIAKIIARLVNCDNLIDGNPCGKCYNCLNYLNSNDIVEIDAASNNGVDEIRELRDKINLVPSNAKYKVYIIDEVHMLTTQAFNALLKTLEEPPSHVIFILATTEPHKIPLTIASRCQKFRFSKIDDEKIVARLSEICKLENISIDNDSLFEIARLSDGGMRDAINFLDQLVAYSSDDINIDDVYKVNGSVSYAELFNLLTYIINNDKVKIIEFIDDLNASGKDINKFLEELLIFLKDVILYKNANILSNIATKNEYVKLIADMYENTDLYKLIESLNVVQNNIKISSHSSIIFMTSILKYSDLNFSDNVELNNNNISDCSNMDLKSNVQDEDSNLVGEVTRNEIKNNDKLSLHDEEIRINNALALASKQDLSYFKSKWSGIDDFLDDSDFSVVSGLLKDCNIVVGSKEYIILESNTLSIVDRINSNLEIVEKLFEKLFNYKVYVVAIDSNKWIDIKNKYISDLKNGIKYYVKDINTNVNNNDELNNSSSIDDLIDLVGENIIEYK